MKSERRHELETNELADWLGHATERYRPFFKPMIALLLVGTVVWLGRALLLNNSRRTRDESWTALFSTLRLRDPDALRSVAETFPNSTAAPWAYQSAGDVRLEKGTNRLLVDRAEGNKILLEAAKDYEKAFSTAEDDMVRQRALLGLAQVHEALGDVTKAKVQYHKIATTWPEEPAADLANRRMEFVSRKDTSDFLNWFAEQKVEEAPAGSTTSPKAPSIYDDLPSAGDLKLPDLSDLKRSLDMEITPPQATEPPKTDSPTPPENEPK